MESVTNVDAIMHPHDAFLGYKKYLLWQYAEDYGEDKYHLVRERMNQTIYLFESPPSDKMQFINDHFNEITDYKAMLRIETEFQDYIKVKKKIDAQLRKKFYDRVAYHFHIGSDRIRYEELVDLDFDAFSLESLKLLNSETTDEKVKTQILQRQERYCEICRLYGLKPITDWRVISFLKRYENQLNSIEKKALIKHSKWGKRIQKEVNSQSKIKITPDVLAEIVFGKKTASTNTIIQGKEMTRLCYFPVMKVSGIGELDRLFFHENRHVVETDRNCSGIDNYQHSKYTLLNEIRTEKNAGVDSLAFTAIPLFSNAPMSAKHFNCYRAVFPYTEGFFEQYREELNDIAIENDIMKLEQLYGEDNLVAFNHYLSDIERSYIKNAGPSHLPVDQEKQKQLVFKLHESYWSNNQE